MRLVLAFFLQLLVRFTINTGNILVRAECGLKDSLNLLTETRINSRQYNIVYNPGDTELITLTAQRDCTTVNNHLSKYNQDIPSCETINRIIAYTYAPTDRGNFSISEIENSKIYANFTISSNTTDDFQLKVKFTIREELFSLFAEDCNSGSRCYHDCTNIVMSKEYVNVSYSWSVKLTRKELESENQTYSIIFGLYFLLIVLIAIAFMFLIIRYCLQRNHKNNRYWGVTPTNIDDKPPTINELNTIDH